MLRTYLRDHHAGSTGGLELARRAAGNNRDNSYGPELSQIAEDKQSLEALMDHLDCSADRIKDTIAWAGEKLARLKPNDRLLRYSPLSRLVELEGLALGVTGKRGLWRAVRPVLGDRAGGVEIADLEARAEDQRSRLEALRERAAAEALGRD